MNMKESKEQNKQSNITIKPNSKDTYKENRINSFIDMINTYSTNYPYLIFNCKISIEDILKVLDYELLRKKNLYDLDYTLNILQQKNRLSNYIANKVTELSNFIRKIESGKVPITYKTTTQVLIETASIMLEILYTEENDADSIDDPVIAVYRNKIKTEIQKRFEDIAELIKSRIKENDESEVIDIIGPVYFYSSGEMSVGKSKRAAFVDLENLTVIVPPAEDTFKKRNGDIEDILRMKVLTPSAEQISVCIWRNWKQFKDSLKIGTKISLLNLAVKNFPDFEEVHLLDRSLLILKPDILINATTISKVIQNKGYCINKYIMDLKKRNITNSKAALRGIMIGEIIDDYVLKKEDFDFQKSFEKHYRKKLHKTPFIKEGFDPKQIFHQISSQLYVIDTFVWNRDKPVYDRPQYIEPFYMSPRYGLEGRMDMMYLDREKEKLRIYELKSGKAPSSNQAPWDNHSYQTYCYQLILDSAYNYKNTKSFVLYSSSENPVRILDFDLSIEIITARNKIIELIDKLTDEKTDREEFLKIQKESMCFNCPPYMKTDCMKDYELFHKELSPEETDYYIGFFKLLEREKLQSHLLSSYLWKKTLPEREILFTAISNLSIENINDGLMTLRINKENNSDIRSGDQIFIHRGNPVREEVFRGSVIDIRKNNIIINLHKDFPEEMPTDGWYVDRAYSTSGINAQHSGLYSFISGNQRTKNLILGKTKPEFKKRIYKKVKSELELNDKQKEAFELCLKAKDYALIQGPPGTGKTYTIASIINQMVKEGKKILITAYTNRAVDNILNMLKDKFEYKDFLRIGSIYNIDPEILPYTIDNKVNDYEIDEIDALKKEIMSKQVFASTTTSAITTLIFDNIKFDAVIVDEAGQMTEPSTLTVINFADKFLLFGDDKQLPPIVTDESLKKPFSHNEVLKEKGLTNLSKSLFERLWKLNKLWEKENPDFQSTTTLNIQYRMNKEISDISDKFFYNNIIISYEENRNHTIKDFDFKLSTDSETYHSVLNPEIPISLIHCIDDRVSKENLTEANLIYHIIYNLLAGGIKPEQIGVIAPYKAQCALIRRQIDAISIAGKEASDIIVDTVERYQGGEREIIIVSFTVGDAKMLNFLTEENEDPLLNRKLNVSITRAKRKLIMLGNTEVLKQDRVYRQLIYYMESRGLVFEIK